MFINIKCKMKPLQLFTILVLRDNTLTPFPGPSIRTCCTGRGSSFLHAPKKVFTCPLFVRRPDVVGERPLFWNLQEHLGLGMADDVRFNKQTEKMTACGHRP